MKQLLQTDPLWEKDLLKGTSLSVGRIGCALTCLSMASDYFGRYKNPGELAKTFDFLSDGRMLWASLQLLDLGFKLQDRMNFAQKTQDGAWAVIKKYAYDPIVLTMIQLNNSHWVIINKDNYIDGVWDRDDGDDDDNWLDVLDPIYGSRSIYSNDKNKIITGIAVLIGDKLPVPKPASDWAKKEWDFWVKEGVVTTSDPKSAATKEWACVVIERRLSLNK